MSKMSTTFPQLSGTRRGPKRRVQLLQTSTAWNYCPGPGVYDNTYIKPLQAHTTNISSQLYKRWERSHQREICQTNGSGSMSGKVRIEYIIALVRSPVDRCHGFAKTDLRLAMTTQVVQFVRYARSKLFKLCLGRVVTAIGCRPGHHLVFSQS